MIEVDSDLIFHAFEHFFGQDQANASVHMAEVKFSPITFRLAEALSTDSYYFDVTDVAIVLAHKGKYEEDQGR